MGVETKHSKMQKPGAGYWGDPSRDRLIAAYRNGPREPANPAIVRIPARASQASQHAAPGRYRTGPHPRTNDLTGQSWRKPSHRETGWKDEGNGLPHVVPASRILHPGRDAGKGQMRGRKLSNCQAHSKNSACYAHLNTAQSMPVQMIWVSPESSLELRMEADRAGKIAHADLPYDQYPYSLNDPILEFRMHALIAKQDDSIVGLTVIDARQNIAHIDWPNISKPFLGPTEQTFHWTITSIWVGKKYRRRNIATEMINKVASQFVTPANQLAFLAPLSDDAFAFLNAMFPGKIYISL